MGKLFAWFQGVQKEDTMESSPRVRKEHEEDTKGLSGEMKRESSHRLSFNPAQSFDRQISSPRYLPTASQSSAEFQQNDEQPAEFEVNPMDFDLSNFSDLEKFFADTKQINDFQNLTENAMNKKYGETVPQEVMAMIKMLTEGRNYGRLLTGFIASDPLLSEKLGLGILGEKIEKFLITASDKIPDQLIEADKSRKIIEDLKAENQELKEENGLLQNKLTDLLNESLNYGKALQRIYRR